jgi:TPP-dependent pyruvate/acetoin dehydrogenase alpha subunit
VPEIPEATTLEMYRKMTELRLFEKRAHDLFLQNLVKGTTHLGTGQEAVAAGVSQAMNEDDYTLPRPQPRAGPRHPDDPGDGRTARP